MRVRVAVRFRAPHGGVRAPRRCARSDGGIHGSRRRRTARDFPGRLMRIAVIGAGGVGGYFGGKLADGGADVTFIVRGATLEAMRTRGLRVDSIKGDFVVEHPNATDDPASAGKADAIFVTVKTWQIAEAAEQIKPMIGEETMVVPLENGIDAPEQLAAIVGREHVLGGLCGIVSFIVSPGHITHAGADPFVMFGELDNRRT